MKLRKFNPFTHDVIFIDGLSGTGKSVLGPIVSGMHGVEKVRIDHIFEYLCALQSLKLMDADATTAMLQTHADIDQYNNLIGREVNLRWRDDSGAGNHPGSLRYVCRMFGPDGDGVVQRINEENLALTILSHGILPVAEPLVEAFGRRLKLIEMVRHPLYMVTHLHAFLSRFDAPRIFTLCFDVRGNKVPWFAADWHEEFLSLSVMDRVLACIARLYKRVFQSIDAMSDEGVPLLVVSFEHLVLDTQPVLRQLEQFLGRSYGTHLKRILRKQKLPRRRLTHGRGHAVYNWQPGRDVSEGEEYERLLARIRETGSTPYLRAFADLIPEYNRRWPSTLGQFHRAES